MAYVTPGTVAAGDVATAAAWNVVVGDIVDHELYVSPIRAAWTAYNSPTQSGWSLGNGTIAAAYLKTGSVCIYAGQVTFGSTTSFTGSVRIGVPFSGGKRNAIGSAILVDGTTYYHGLTYIDNSVDANLMGIIRSGGASSAAYVGSTTPFTWGTGDYFSWSITYEVAV
jgi:hypothetical protein